MLVGVAWFYSHCAASQVAGYLCRQQADKLLQLILFTEYSNK